MFDLTITWKQVQTTAEPCDGCKEPIYGNQYQQHFNGKPTEQKLCEPCYELMKKEQEKLDERE